MDLLTVLITAGLLILLDVIAIVVTWGIREEGKETRRNFRHLFERDDD